MLYLSRIYIHNTYNNLTAIDREGYAAVLSDGGPGDTTSLSSEPVRLETPHYLSFRYKLLGTSQCLEINVEDVTDGTENNSKRKTHVVWEQCRSKGLHWLSECVDLPFNKSSNYQVL